MPPPKTPKDVSDFYIFPLTANIIGVVVFSQLRPKAQASVARAADTRPLGCGVIPVGEDVAYTSSGVANLPDHGLCHLIRRCGASEISRLRAARDRGFQRIEDAPAGFGVTGMFEKEGRGPDRPG